MGDSIIILPPNLGVLTWFISLWGFSYWIFGLFVNLSILHFILRFLWKECLLTSMFLNSLPILLFPSTFLFSFLSCSSVLSKYHYLWYDFLMLILLAFVYYWVFLCFSMLYKDGYLSLVLEKLKPDNFLSL